MMSSPGYVPTNFSAVMVMRMLHAPIFFPTFFANHPAGTTAVEITVRTDKARGVKVRFTLAIMLLALLANPLSVFAGQHGFLVFSTRGVENYLLEPNGKLMLAGKGSGAIDEYLTADGNIYRLNKLLHSISKVGSDLKPVLEAKIDPDGDVPDWIGTWAHGLVVLNDNKLLYFDFSLKEVARLALDPVKIGNISPSLHPKTFLAWKGQGYLLVNNNELFIIPLGKPAVSRPLKSAIDIEHGLYLDGAWIDPDENTFNLLYHTQKEDHGSGLNPGEWRVVLNDAVLTWRLDAPGDQPRRTIIHEKKEIHWFMNPVHGAGDDNVRYELMPPSRDEGVATGVRITMLSRSIPCYAEAFVEKPGTAFPPRIIVRLGSFDQYVVQQPSRDQNGLWISLDGERRYIDHDLKALQLVLQPESYALLNARPELTDTYFRAIAY